MKVNFSYLDRQFNEVDDYLKGIKDLVKTGDFTLGKPLVQFEERFASLCKMKYAIGVGSGTDALILSLKAVGIGPGDEVITTPMTFIATVGAIVMTGARPVFVDSEDGFVIDATKIENAITPKTKAIIPVHYSGNVADMPIIEEIAGKYKLTIIEDACQSIAADLDNKPVGTWGISACFSLHPLKNLNVWGDGGIIVTKSEEMAEKLRLWRNHGLVNRDEITMFGTNSRLDTLQAVIGNKLIEDVDWITEQRISNANYYDKAFTDLVEYVHIPVRRTGVKHVYHLYMLRVEKRDKLLNYLNERGIEAKVHYPIPVHLQKGAQYLGYTKGDFPQCESDCANIITLPAHQHLTQDQLAFVVEAIEKFYRM